MKVEIIAHMMEMRSITSLLIELNAFSTSLGGQLQLNPLEKDHA